MDAIVLLREDHKRVEKPFEQFERDCFSDIRKSMGRRRLTELGEQLEAEKKKASRVPLAVPSAAGQ
ncbi:hypothetical protein J7F03_30960 [Streptomyces sp. ISL-43]|uniref:hypothetical protein n=1 Tax=Streptomyces sp. ISL-43 TaxID=2819183 RepID=UPI001BE5F975|nr:hypothetical protein [Streptomyces sp. ISL-43]MBT2451409.1 hypothetical protein [Streptomyces sp. ISL-43]